MPKSYHNIIVYIPEEECYGVTMSHGAYASLVRYQVDGIDHEVFIPNEDLIFLHDITIGIEEEEL